MADVELRRYLQKRRAFENKKLQLAQHFDRIDYKLDVVDPIIEDAKKTFTGNTVPILEIEAFVEEETQE